MEARRRSMWTTGPVPVSFRSMTVAARLGTTGVRLPSVSARIRSGHSGGYHCPSACTFAMAGGYPVAGGCSSASWGGGRQPERTRTTVSGRRGRRVGRRRTAGDRRQAERATSAGGNPRRRRAGAGEHGARPARPLPSAPPHTWGTTATPPVLGPGASAHGPRPLAALWAFGVPWEGGGEDLRLGQLHLDLDLDRRVQRQHRDAHRAARVDALVAEDLGQQLTGTVDDTGLAREVRGG